MSFLQRLIKGFIRSAVNQVGRDGGKVISNQIYGDAHSTPYRRVDASAPMTDHDADIEEEAIREIPKSGFWKKCLYAFLLYVATAFSAALFAVFPLLCVIPPLLVALVGYRRLHKDKYTVRLIRYTSIPTYTTDRRYKNGRRYAGDIIQKQITLADATMEEEEEIKRRAKWWYYAAAAVLLLGIIGGIAIQNDKSQKTVLKAVRFNDNTPTLATTQPSHFFAIAEEKRINNFFTVPVIS